MQNKKNRIITISLLTLVILISGGISVRAAMSQADIQWLISNLDLNSAQKEKLNAYSSNSLSGKYSITVKYDESVDDLLKRTNTPYSSSHIDPNILLGVYPLNNTDIGTKTLNVELKSLEDFGLWPLSAGSTCTALVSKIKQAGYRPLNLQEMINFNGKYPDVADVAWGTLLRLGKGGNLVTGQTTAGNYIAAAVLPGKAKSNSDQSGLLQKRIGFVGVCNDSGRIGNIGKKGVAPAFNKVAPRLPAVIALVKDADYTGEIPSIDSLPMSLSSNNARVLVEPKEYEIEVNYSDLNFGTHQGSYKSITNDTGTKKVKMKLAKIVGVENTTQDAAKAIIEGLNGYRPATASELYYFNKAMGKTVPLGFLKNDNIMAFGTINQNCESYPLINLGLENWYQDYKLCILSTRNAKLVAGAKLIDNCSFTLRTNQLGFLVVPLDN